MDPDVWFCPSCDGWLGGAAACSACGWRCAAAPEAGTELWRYDAGARLRCTSLTLAGGRLLFGDVSSPGPTGRVHALSVADGSLLWCATLPTGVPAGSLAADATTVYVSAAEGGELEPDKPLLALDAAGGMPVWQYVGGSLDLGAPLLHDGILYIASADRRLHAVDAASGKAHWVAGLGGWGRSAPTACDALLFLGTEQNGLLGLDLAGGRERWRFEGGGAFAASPSAREGMVYAACWDGVLYAVEAHGGRPAWHCALSAEASLLTPPLLAGECVWVGCSDGCLYAVDRLRGEMLFKVTTGGRVSAAPAMGEGCLYLGSEDRHLYVLDVQTGRVLRKQNMPGRVGAAPMVAPGRLVVACRDGQVVALVPDAAEAVAAPSPGPAVWLEMAGGLAAQGRHMAAARAYLEGGDRHLAAEQYEVAGRWEDALDSFRIVGDALGAARCLDRSGRADEAAGELERAGLWEPAAQRYAALEKWRKAGELYHTAGELGEAARCFEAVEEWLDAAEIYERLGMLREKARCLESAGEPKAAGKAYQLAAVKLEQETLGRQEAVLAELYHKAETNYHGAYEIELEEQCRKKARFYRRQPDLTLALELAQGFVEGERRIVDLHLINHGRGVAYDVRVTLVPAEEGTFTGVLTKSIEGIGSCRSRSDTLQIRPNARGTMYLDLCVGYRAREGERLEERASWRVAVAAATQPSAASPPQVVIIGDLVIGQKGDIGELVIGHKGDSVAVTRKSGEPAIYDGRLSPIPADVSLACKRCGCKNAPGASYCEQCGESLWQELARVGPELGTWRPTSPSRRSGGV